MVAQLVNILLRQARENNAANPRAWLIALQSSNWSTVNTQGGQIASTSVNGKAVTLAQLPGMTLAHILVASEQAIQVIEQGLDRYPTSATAAAR
jgi:hypothetical protein